MSRPKVVLDANALFPFSLRDTLLRVAAEDFFQPHWSREILTEVSRNLVTSLAMSPAQAERLVDAMTNAFPEALVTGYEHLIASMPNQEKDRHVAALAAHVGASVIVTSNLKDFRALPRGIEARSPDRFLCSIFSIHPTEIVEILHQQSAALRRPPRSFGDLLRGLAKTVPDFVAAVVRFVGQDD